MILHHSRSLTALAAAALTLGMLVAAPPAQAGEPANATLTVAGTKVAWQGTVKVIPGVTTQFDLTFTDQTNQPLDGTVEAKFSKTESLASDGSPLLQTITTLTADVKAGKASVAWTNTLAVNAKGVVTFDFASTSSDKPAAGLFTVNLLGSPQPPPVIVKIANQTIAKNKKVSIKPKVTVAGQIKIDSAKLTVKQGKKTIAKNKAKVKLKPGKYSVTTTAKYRTWTVEPVITKTPKTYLAGDTVEVTCTVGLVTTIRSGLQVLSVVLNEVSCPKTAATPELVKQTLTCPGSGTRTCNGDFPLRFSNIPGQNSTQTYRYVFRANTTVDVEQQTGTKNVYAKAKTIKKTQKLTIKAKKQ
ncbi:MAG: hypothetical protein LBG70_04625 [Bifidobacteriaceae bacterium]|jgi:hypothetical protein|nr:hypothetical protein [Bifidobacteriaceae bacterium]